MTQTYKVQVSMNQANIVESGFVLKQGDFGFNIEIEVLDFDTTGATPQIIFRKSTGAVEATEITRAGNKFTYAIRGTELDTPGPCVCDLKLNDSTTKRVSTASFKYFVIPDTMDGLEQEASSYSDTIEQLMENTLQKSATAGLVKNDGSIDTNKYALFSNTATKHDTNQLGVSLSDTQYSNLNNITYWEQGSISGTGEETSILTRIRTGYILLDLFDDVILYPASGYKYSITYYDENRSFSGEIGWSTVTYRLVRAENWKYARIILSNSSNTQINPSEGTNLNSILIYHLRNNEESYSSILDNLEEYTLKNGGAAIINPNRFILASLGTSGGTIGTYRDTIKRAATKTDSGFVLKAGDLIKINDNTLQIGILYVQNGTGTIKNSGWVSSFVCPEDNTYYVQIHASTEENQTSVFNYVSKLSITRSGIDNNIQYDFGDIIIKGINHRGYNMIAPENTLPAFVKSKQAGFDFVETDIRFTSDNVAVLCHNDDISHTSNGTGNISEMTYEQLLQYDFGSWKNSRYAGTKIPTLEQFLILCRSLKLFAYLELINNGDSTKLTKTQIQIITGLVKKYHLENAVSYIASDIDNLKSVLIENKQARVGYIIGDSDTSVELAEIAELPELDTGYNEVFADIYYANYINHAGSKAALIALGYPIEVFTPNYESSFNLLDDNVTGATSDQVNYKYLCEAKQIKSNNQFVIVNNRVDSIDGIISVDSGLCKIALQFVSNYTASNEPSFINYLPKPLFNKIPVEIKDITASTTSIDGYIDTNGTLYLAQSTADHTYYIYGLYPVSQDMRQ